MLHSATVRWHWYHVEHIVGMLTVALFSFALVAGGVTSTVLMYRFRRDRDATFQNTPALRRNYLIRLVLSLMYGVATFASARGVAQVLGPDVLNAFSAWENSSRLQLGTLGSALLAEFAPLARRLSRKRSEGTA